VIAATTIRSGFSRSTAWNRSRTVVKSRRIEGVTTALFVCTTAAGKPVLGGAVPKTRERSRDREHRLYNFDETIPTAFGTAMGRMDLVWE